MLHSQFQSETTLAQLQVVNTAALLARGVAATLDKARLAVDGVADRLESDLARPGLQRSGLWPMVDRAVERVPELQAIGLFDQNGEQICGVPVSRCRGLQVSQRDYFRQIRDAPAAEPALFGPMASLLDGRQALILGRALRHPDGQFAGVVIGLLPLQGLEAIVTKASLGPGGVASLRMADQLTLLARAPAIPSEQQATHLAALAAVLGDQLARAPQAGLFSVVSTLDGQTRISAYQKLPGYPIYALVGDAEADSLAAWRHLLLWVSGFLLIFAAASLVIERALTRSHRSEQRAQALFDEAPCGYHTLDAQGRFLSINATELLWLGRQREEVVGHARAADFLTEEGRATFAREFPRLLAGETLHGLEYDLVGADGSMRRVAIDASPVLDDQGRFHSSNTVMHDVTALHAARQALLQENARQQLLLDNRLVGIARIHNQRFVWVNAAFERMFGYGSAELIHQDTAILHPTPADFSAFGEAARAALAQHGTHRAVLELRRKDGSSVWADCSGTVLDAASGELIWFSLDVTASRRAEALRVEAADLAAENRQLQETARLHSMFLSNMSHELRTPLNAVLGFVELLQMPSIASDADTHASYLSQIRASGQHLLAMIERLLDLANAEAGRLVLEPAPVDARATVQEVIGMLEAKAQDASVVLRNATQALPLVQLDPLRLKQVLLNFLSNAIKFSHGGGQVIVTAAMAGPGRLRVEVQDEGIGISDADQTRLFVRFRQLSTGMTKAYEGTGIGLALVKQIVEAQGGRVGVRSEVGRGSVFWAEWPVGA